MLFYQFVYTAVFLTPIPDRLGMPIVPESINSGSKGYVIDLNTTYYALTRDGSNMYYPNTASAPWQICGGYFQTTTSYAYYEALKKVYKIQWNPGTTFSITIHDVTDNCDNPVQLQKLSLWGDVSHALSSIKASITNNNLNVEVRMSSNDIYIIYLSNIGDSGQLYINKVGTASNFYLSTVVADNQFLYLKTISGNTYLVSTNATTIYTDFSGITTSSQSVKSSYIITDVSSRGEFPTFDFNMSVPSDNTFLYISGDKAVKYNFKLFTSSFIVVGYTDSAYTRYYFKNTIFDVGNTGGKAINVYLDNDISTPYYTTTKGSGSLAISAYWNNSNLVITNQNRGFSITYDGFTPSQYEFSNYFQVSSSSIHKYCSNNTALTLFRDSAQSNLVPRPNFQFNFTGAKITGMKYSNNANAIIAFSKAYSFIPNSNDFLTSVAPLVKYNDFVNATHYAIDISDLLSQGKNIYSPTTIINSTLYVSNVCKSQSSVGVQSGTVLYFQIEKSNFQQFNSDYNLIAYLNGTLCNDALNTTRNIGSSTAYRDTALSATVFKQITFKSGNLMVIPMPLPFKSALSDYIDRGLNISFSLSGKRCGPDLLSNFTASIINLSASTLEIPVDERSYDVATFYSLDISVFSSASYSACDFTTRITFNAGSSEYFVTNWLESVYYSNAKFTLNFTSSFLNLLDNSFPIQVDTLSATIQLSGCPATQSISVNLINSLFDGKMMFELPSVFNNTLFYFQPTIQGTYGTCKFKSNLDDPLKASGPNYIDSSFNPEINLSSSSDQLALAPLVSTASLLSNYMSRSFEVQVSLQGTTFPYSNSIVTLNNSNFINNMIYISNPLEYSPCTRSFDIQFRIQSKYCPLMTFNTTSLYGNGVYSIENVSSMLQTYSDGKIATLFGNRTLALPFSDYFKVTFGSAAMNLSATLTSDTCGILNTNSISYDATRDLYLSFPDVSNIWSRFQLLVTGVSDLCLFSLNYSFSAGTDNYLNTTLSNVVVNADDISFVNPNVLRIDGQYSKLFSSYANIESHATINNCFTTSGAYDTFAIPAEFLNNTANYTLYNNITSYNCKQQYNYTFTAGNPPVIQKAYLDVDSLYTPNLNIKVVGSNMGVLSASNCTRYMIRINSVALIPVIWTNTLIVASVAPGFNINANQISAAISIGPFDYDVPVVVPFTEFSTWMNNNLQNGTQVVTFKLNSNGISDGEWSINNDNSLHGAFVKTNGLVNEDVIVQLPRNKLANKLTIAYKWTSSNIVIPGLIVLNIRRTPIIGGQSISSSISNSNGNYEFSFKLSDYVKYSLVDYEYLVNTYTSSTSNGQLTTNNSPSNTPNSSYKINATFKILNKVLGTATYEGLEDGFNTTIGEFAIINNVETIDFEQGLVRWIFDDQDNNYLFKTGDFPLMLNVSFKDVLKWDSIALFTIATTLDCQNGTYPNVFGSLNKRNKIPLCANCPVGALCSSTGLQVPIGQKGYYELVSNGQYQYAACIPSDACTGSQICNDGYEGNRCGSCSLQHYRTGGNICGLCPKMSAAAIALIAVAVIMIFVFVLYIMLKYGRYFAAISIAINYFQILYIFKSLFMNWSDKVMDMFEIFSIFSFNIELAAPECVNPAINYFSKGEFMFLLPPTILIALIMVSIILAPPFNYPYLYLRGLLHKKPIVLPRFEISKIESNLSNGLRGFHILLQLMYVSLTSWALGYFNCYQFGDQTVMTKSPTFECNTGLHLYNLPYFLMAVIFYVVGIPLYFSTLYVLMYQTKVQSALANKIKEKLHLILRTDVSIFKRDTQFIIVAQIMMKFVILMVQNFISTQSGQAEDQIATQAVIIQLALFTYIGFLIYFKPYNEKDHTLADIFCQICSVLTIGCGILFLTTPRPSTRIEGLTVIVIGITTACIVSSVLFVAKDIRRGTRDILEKRKSSDDDEGARNSVRSTVIAARKSIKKADFNKNAAF
eukprot:NODE_228_length_13820_cov_0.664893.p1 type:complete len:1943 gc:universal NODE_228_length_13820_cov_0.664893:12388-6560(-)